MAAHSESINKVTDGLIHVEPGETPAGDILGNFRGKFFERRPRLTEGDRDRPSIGVLTVLI